MPDLTPDQHAEKIRLKFSGPRDERRALHDALDALLALAKRGEAFDAALAHARSLYTRDEELSTAELAMRVHDGFRAAFTAADFDRYPKAEQWIEAGSTASSELVIRASGHVPVEAFAAAMTALEQAEQQRDERTAELSNVRAVAWREIKKVEADRDRLAAALHTAEKERLLAEAALHMDRADEKVIRAERDRLAAELEAMGYGRTGWPEALGWKKERDRLAAALDICAICGHEWRRHDLEDGMCDAHSKEGLGACSCGRDLTWMQAKIAAISKADLEDDSPGRIAREALAQATQEQPK